VRNDCERTSWLTQCCAFNRLEAFFAYVYRRLRVSVIHVHAHAFTPTTFITHMHMYRANNMKKTYRIPQARPLLLGHFAERLDQANGSRRVERGRLSSRPSVAVAVIEVGGGIAAFVRHCFEKSATQTGLLPRACLCIVVVRLCKDRLTNCSSCDLATCCSFSLAAIIIEPRYCGDDVVMCDGVQKRDKFNSRRKGGQSRAEPRKA
jgi:hypothetical protein